MAQLDLLEAQSGNLTQHRMSIGMAMRIPTR
jgi:hypothetical protein